MATGGVLVGVGVIWSALQIALLSGAVYAGMIGVFEGSSYLVDTFGLDRGSTGAWIGMSVLVLTPVALSVLAYRRLRGRRDGAGGTSGRRETR